MRGYSMGYFDVLRLPLTTFWSLNRQLGRLRAEEDHRHLRIIGAGQDAKSAKQLGEALDAEIGNPVVVEKAFNAKKFEELAKKFKPAA